MYHNIDQHETYVSVASARNDALRPGRRMPYLHGTRTGHGPCPSSLIGHSGSSAFQTIHHYSVDVAHGLVLLFGIGTRGPSIMGFEDEGDKSIGRPCRQTNGRHKRTYELTSSIVPRGTSFHRSVELECPSIGLDAARFLCCCCCGLFSGP